MLQPEQRPEIEIRPIRQGILTRAYLAVVRWNDQVVQKSFAVETGSGTSQAVRMAAYNWGRGEAYKMWGHIRRQERAMAKSRVLLDMMIDDTSVRSAIVRERELLERKAEAVRHAEAVKKATSSLRYAMSRYDTRQHQMNTSYANVYGELARCPWS